MIVFLCAAWLHSNLAIAQVKLFDEPLKPLAVTLTADFKLINTPDQSGAELGRTDLGQGMADPQYFKSAGTLAYKDEQGNDVVLAVEIEPRGMRRRHYCQYKPLDIKFLAQPSDELFKNSTKSVEMVTHCQGESYLNSVFTEYFAYRTKNALVAPSFRVRMADITYVDTTGKFPTVTYPGIFLEPKKGMAKRVAATVFDLTDAEKKVPFSQTEISNGQVWASMYGDSFVPKMMMRARVYNKYIADLGKVGQTLEQAFLQILGRAVVQNYDVSESYLVNVFPIQFTSGALQMVEYDFDGVNFSEPTTSNVLTNAFAEYAKGLKMTLADYKTKRTAVEKQNDQKEVLAAIDRVLNGYTASGLDGELSSFTDPHYDTKNLSGVLTKVIDKLKAVQADPKTAFSFL